LPQLRARKITFFSKTHFGYFILQSEKQNQQDACRRDESKDANRSWKVRGKNVVIPEDKLFA
jgi:hypothetical protein